MTDLLKATLHDEAVKRDTEAAKKAAYQEEFDRIVKGIHEAFAPYEDDVWKLQLTGDYGRPVPAKGHYTYSSRVGDDKKDYPIRTAHGLVIDLGSNIAKEYLYLTVNKRTDTAPPTVRLWIERYYPYKSADIKIFDGFTPPEEMLQAFFQTLAPRIYNVKDA